MCTRHLRDKCNQWAPHVKAGNQLQIKNPATKIEGLQGLGVQPPLTQHRRFDPQRDRIRSHQLDCGLDCDYSVETISDY